MWKYSQCRFFFLALNAVRLLMKEGPNKEGLESKLDYLKLNRAPSEMDDEGGEEQPRAKWCQEQQCAAVVAFLWSMRGILIKSFSFLECQVGKGHW